MTPSSALGVPRGVGVDAGVEQDVAVVGADEDAVDGCEQPLVARVAVDDARAGQAQHSVGEQVDLVCAHGDLLDGMLHPSMPRQPYDLCSLQLVYSSSKPSHSTIVSGVRLTEEQVYCCADWIFLKSRRILGVVRGGQFLCIIIEPRKLSCLSVEDRGV